MVDTLLKVLHSEYGLDKISDLVSFKNDIQKIKDKNCNLLKKFQDTCNYHTDGVSGFDVEYPKGFKSTDEAVAAAINSKAETVVICSTDDTYPDLVPPLAKGIKEKNSDMVIVLAGYPKDQIDAHKESGVDEKTAEKLKGFEEIKAPEWSLFVKTGPHKERPPMDNDWWFFRAAAILRSVYRLGPIGVNKLRTKYGGKKRRGHQPPTFKKGSGNIIRKCLQQLEKAGLIKNIEKGQHKGRVLTPKGISLLDKTAGEILKTKPKIGLQKK